MRLRLTSTLIIIVIITLTLHLQSINEAACTEEVKVTINRVIDLRANYVLIEDEITILQGELKNITYHIPKIYEERIYNIKAVDEKGEEIRYSMFKKDNQTCIQFNIPQTPIKFKVKICWIKVLTPLIDQWKISLPLHPTIPIPVEEIQVTVLLPPETISINMIIPNATTHLEERWTAKYNRTSLNPMSNKTLLIGFTARIQYILGRSIIREIFPDSKILIKETITFENTGLADITKREGVNFTLPPQAAVTSVTDDFGQLTYETYNKNSSVILNVKPRINIKREWKYRIFVQYELPSNQWLTGNGERKLTVPIKQYHKFPIDLFKVIVHLPSGSKLISTDGTTPTLTSENKVTYLGEKIVGDLSLQEASITYTTPPGTFTIPTNIIIGVVMGIIIGTAVFIRRYMVKPKRRIQLMESEVAAKIDELNDAMREKIETLLSLRELEETLRRKKIARKAHKVRVKELRKELRKINMKIGTLKDELKGKSIKIKATIDEIDNAERELTNLVMKAIESERQYMLKRLSRAAFEERRRKLERDIRKARLKIESKITDLIDIVT